MKKIFLLLFMLASVMCYAQQNTATTDVGVVINGVRWATRNVDAPGTFATTPESAGMFFQWNRQRGWPATDEVAGWNTSAPAGTTWARDYDPCPPGWRVPTLNELRGLLDAGSVWVTRDGVDGRLFGTAPNYLFLPAADWRTTVGTLSGVGAPGVYWSSSASPIAGTAMSLRLLENESLIRNSFRANGFLVRCVAE